MAENYVLSDRYELRHELGRGGMGTVYRAVDLRLRRTVAVKPLSPEFAHDPNCRARPPPGRARRRCGWRRRSRCLPRCRGGRWCSRGLRPRQPCPSRRGPCPSRRRPRPCPRSRRVRGRPSDCTRPRRACSPCWAACWPWSAAGCSFVEAPHFRAVALLAALLGGCALLWSARLACVVAWGPVAETLAVQSEFRRAYLSWDTKPVLLALGLAAVTAVCVARCLSRHSPDGGFAAVGAWFTGAFALWFFLDDQNKTAVFYAVLLAATLTVGVGELLRRLRPGTRGPGRGDLRGRAQDKP